MRRHAVLLAIVGLYVALSWPIEVDWRPRQSGWILDRQGHPLAEVLAPDSVRTAWAGLEEMPPALLGAFVAAEDSRFFLHPGVDPLALARAAAQDLRARRIVSGGSTITQQVARLLFPRPRTLWGKLLEASRAVQLEFQLTKSEILEQYLNRAPLGNQLYGIRAAARVYLGKSLDSLSIAECAMLAALPRAPTWLNPYRRLPDLLKRQRQVLRRMREMGTLTPEQETSAAQETITLRDTRGLLRAPHFTRYLLDRRGEPAMGRPLRTTLDLGLQSDLEAALRNALTSLEGRAVGNGAILVLDTRTREVLAWVGSRDFTDEKEGQVDGVLALRQPGSTLKPFTYLEALRTGQALASTVFADVPTSFPTESGAYTPANYDNQFHGPVRLRVALASSLNVPAVETAQRVGPASILRLLRGFGMESLDRQAEYYGLALTLGGGEVRLLELANAYASLAEHGLWRPVRLLLDEPPGAPAKVVEPPAADLILDILSDDQARTLSFGEDSVLELPFPAAVKTGTSKNFRDNWCVGATSEVTVAVWVGNFSGQPMAQVSGVTGAGPVWRQAMQRAMQGRPRRPLTAHAGLVEEEVCSLSGRRPTELCPSRVLEWFLSEHRPEGECALHQRFLVNSDASLLADPACPQPGDHLRSFEAYPPPLREWAARVHRPVPPSAKFDCGELGEQTHFVGAPAQALPDSQGPGAEPLAGSRGGAPGSPELVILSPVADGFYAYDPGIPEVFQKMRMRALAPPGRVLSWSLNGVALAEGVAQVDWPVRRGEYRLEVSTSDAGPPLRAEVRFLVK